MKGKEEHNVEELFRSKLYDFEMDTTPEDWEAIADRLSDRKVVLFRRRLYYWAAAASVLLLMVTGGVYWSAREVIPSSVVQQIEKQHESVKSDFVPVEKPVVASAAQTEKQPTYVAGMRRAGVGMRRAVMPAEEKIIVTEDESVEEEPKQVMSVNDTVSDTDVLSDEATTYQEVQPKKQIIREAKPRKRKWGFGMGAGSLSMGADHMVPSYVTNSTSLRGESLMLMNAPYFNKELPKTDIHHKKPLSFGVSASRYLTERLSLQLGLNYSFLQSEWTTNGDYYGRTKQKLHFIGLPVSLSYKLAEWNRLVFYLSAGVMTEINVAGTLSSRIYNDNNQEITRRNDHVRMKEWLWSVNAATGVSYPVWKFVSAFAEVGASYYFDNGSRIETIHSEKPLNVSLQLGFRLGF